MRLAPLTRLPRGALVLAKEIARHVLRRPVVGIAAAARTPDGSWLLIRRADTGTWALPGGTLEWGETLQQALKRELLEEAGVEQLTFGRLVGVYSRPDRDPRFHAVTILVTVTVEPPKLAPDNPLEILEARLFHEGELPEKLAMTQHELLRDARADQPPVVE